MSYIKYIEAPEVWDLNDDGPWHSVFLAGGITGCSEWQKELVEKLDAREYEGVVLNPRRKSFDVNDPNAAPAQIEWEHKHLQAAELISFWFDADQIQPIVLFEYGYWLRSEYPIVVGIHPNYPRKFDVVHQTMLHCREQLLKPIEIVSTLDELADEIVEYPR